MSALPWDLKHVPFEFKRLPVEDTIQRSLEFCNFMCTRRTVRYFSTDPVPADVIRNIIRAAGILFKHWYFNYMLKFFIILHIPITEMHTFVSWLVIKHLNMMYQLLRSCSFEWDVVGRLLWEGSHGKPSWSILRFHPSLNECGARVDQHLPLQSTSWEIQCHNLYEVLWEHALASTLWLKRPEHKAGVQTTSVMFLHKLLKKKLWVLRRSTSSFLINITEKILSQNDVCSQDLKWIPPECH